MKSQIKTIGKLFELSAEIYSQPNDQLYDLDDLFYYHQKWLLRYIDSRKKNRKDSILKNLLVSVAWFSSIVNRFHIDLEMIIRKRYPYKCPFCLELPCNCQKFLVEKKTLKTGRPTSRMPKNLSEWQKLISKIYPTGQLLFKNLEIIRIQDDLHQHIRLYRRQSGKRHLREIENAAADYFVELLKIFNFLEKDLGKEYFLVFKNGCYVCGEKPCVCFYVE
jgi:hypothetical protein